jgi:hypothetical protein
MFNGFIDLPFHLLAVAVVVLEPRCRRVTDIFQLSTGIPPIRLLAI